LPVLYMATLALIDIDAVLDSLCSSLYEVSLFLICASLDSSCRQPWTEFNKIEVDKGWFNESCPTSHDIWIHDTFPGATLPVFI